MSTRFIRPTLALPLLVIWAALLAAAPLANASDATIRHALKPYKKKLETDIAYLAAFSAPSRSAAPAALHKLSKIRTDLTGASHALQHQTASSSKGTKGRTDVLNALHTALTATSDAKNSATAAHTGHQSTAGTDAKSAKKEINKAIPQFETGGSLLKLF